MIYFQICLMGLIGLCSRQLIKRKRNVPFADVLIPISDEKLGCSECYKVFRGPVTETLRQIHPSTVHVGKIPSKSGEELKLKRKYETLKQELSAAVKNEDYETAAKLHKQIREIENEVKKS
jgi:protein-arginine kinase activator protein McsA